MNIDLNDPKVLLLLQKGLQKVQEERASGVNPPHKGGFIAKKDKDGKVLNVDFRIVLDAAAFDTLLLYDVKQGRKSAEVAPEDTKYAVYAYYDGQYVGVESNTYNKREYEVMLRIRCGEMTVAEARAAGISVYSALKAQNDAIKGVASALMFLRNPNEFAEIASSLKEEDDNSEGEEEAPE